MRFSIDWIVNIHIDRSSDPAATVDHHEVAAPARPADPGADWSVCTDLGSNFAVGKGASEYADKIVCARERTV